MPRVRLQRVPVDEKLVSYIDIACSHEDPKESRHDRYVSQVAGYEWLVNKMAESSQFTPEQQVAFRVLLKKSYSYRNAKEVLSPD
jgi:hypothetical protein